MGMANRVGSVVVEEFSAQIDYYDDVACVSLSHPIQFHIRVCHATYYTYVWIAIKQPLDLFVYSTPTIIERKFQLKTTVEWSLRVIIIIHISTSPPQSSSVQRIAAKCGAMTF